MNSTTLYQQILGLRSPWRVADVKLDLPGKLVEVRVVDDALALHECPCCGKACPGYDHRVRQWRHLDTCQMQTILTADVPRVNCPEHGVLQAKVPWAEPGSRFTALFEAMVIDLLRVTSIKAVADHVKLSWDQVDGIMARAVQRGLARREAKPVTRLGVDETSFQRRHEYVTVVSDQTRGIVLHVADDRKTSILSSYYESLPPAHLSGIELVSMDMWGPYITATERALPDGGRKIAFDKYHVAAHLTKAVDSVRRREHAALLREGDDRLKKTRFDWLRNPSTHDRIKEREGFEALRDSNLQTARAWRMKEAAMDVWEHTDESNVRAMWKWWCGWAHRSRLEPMRRVGRMIKSHLQGIVTAILQRATNAGAESINSRIQRVKSMACGFRNRQRFRNAIYFHMGGLDLLPEGVTHTKV